MLRDLLQAPASELENRRPENRLFLPSFTKKKEDKENESNTTVNINQRIKTQKKSVFGIPAKCQE